MILATLRLATLGCTAAVPVAAPLDPKFDGFTWRRRVDLGMREALSDNPLAHSAALRLRGGAFNLFGMGQPRATISVERQNFAMPQHPTLNTLSADPPVFEVPNFLSADECAAIIAAAESSEVMPPIPYGAKNRIFTGKKYAAGSAGVVDPFFERACAVFGDVPRSRFEPVTVTSYGEGQYQAKHLDARLPHEINRNAQYLAAGGQRIAQIIVYLQAPAAGGTTKFHGSAFGDLAATPEAGKALIFPTATLRGEADERYLHSGEPVEAGTKWIIGTWLMETEREDTDDIDKAIGALWKLAREKS